MDSTIDVGTTKYALYSLSASPSLLTGDLTVPTLWLGGTVSPANTGTRYLELNKTFAPGANTRAMDIQLVGTDNSAVLGLDFTIASSGSNPLLVTAISGQGQYQGTGTMTGQVTGVSASATNTTTGTITTATGAGGGVMNFSTGTITTGKGGSFTVDNVTAGGTIGTASMAQFKLGSNAGTITTLRGLDLSGWTNSATVTTSYGIYMDSSIDVGATKYAIYSTSTSPSTLSGNLTVPNLTVTGTCTGCGGGGAGTPAGTGSEVQYRVSGSTFGAVTGSSVSGGNISLTDFIDFSHTKGIRVPGGSQLQILEGTGAGTGSIFIASSNISLQQGTSGGVNDQRLLISQGFPYPTGIVNDSGVSNIPTALAVAHNSTGTAAVGFGAQLTYRLQSSTTADRLAGNVNYDWIEATDATRKSRTTHTVVYNGTERNAFQYDPSGGTTYGAFSVWRNDGANKNLEIWPDGNNSKLINPNGTFAFGASNTVLQFAIAYLGTGISVPSNGTVAWSPTSNDASSGTSDVALMRDSSGVLAVTNNTAGTYRDLIVRAITITGGGIPQNSQSAGYTLVLADAGKHIYHPSADTTARTFTIPANSSVAYPIGTAITFVNDTGAGTVTISINTDTLVLAGPGTTGNRTLAAGGVATAVKVTSTRWIISGTGLT